MQFPGDNLKFETRTPAEEKLFDFFAVYNCAGAPDSYFEESLSLLRTIKNLWNQYNVTASIDRRLRNQTR